MDPKRAALMGRVRQKGTEPELRLRQAVTRAGGRYRCNVRSIPGWPDLANQRARVAVFVDGCFWHGCPQHFTLPKTRSEYWKAKISRNKARRAAVRVALADWTVFEFFECDLRESVTSAAATVAKALRQ